MAKELDIVDGIELIMVEEEEEEEEKADVVDDIDNKKCASVTM